MSVYWYGRFPLRWRIKSVSMLGCKCRWLYSMACAWFCIAIRSSFAWDNFFMKLSPETLVVETSSAGNPPRLKDSSKSSIPSSAAGRAPKLTECLCFPRLVKLSSSLKLSWDYTLSLRLGKEPPRQPVAVATLLGCSWSWTVEVCGKSSWLNKGHLSPFCACAADWFPYPTEHFSKLIYVTEILFHRPYEACENSDTDIEELISQPW